MIPFPSFLFDVDAVPALTLVQKMMLVLALVVYVGLMSIVRAMSKAMRDLHGDDEDE